MSASRNATNSQRPLSPHLFIYKPIITMMMSIVHRITGCALYFGTFLVAIWLLAAASGPEVFDAVQAIYGSWIGLLVIFGYTWVLIHHMLGGLRHFAWDTGHLDGKETARKLSWGTIFASIILTAVIWVVGLMVI